MPYDAQAGDTKPLFEGELTLALAGRVRLMDLIDRASDNWIYD
jgi:hypothetical protein